MELLTIEDEETVGEHLLMEEKVLATPDERDGGVAKGLSLKVRLYMPPGTDFLFAISRKLRGSRREQLNSNTSVLLDMTSEVNTEL